MFVFSLFNYTVPWLSVLLIVLLGLVSIILYYIPLRYLILAFVINKFTKRFRKPKGYIDNNEIADFMSRLPSDPELVSRCERAARFDVRRMTFHSRCNTVNSKFSLVCQPRRRPNVRLQVASNFVTFHVAICT